MSCNNCVWLKKRKSLGEGKGAHTVMLNVEDYKYSF
jgi:hypothetical protein